MSAVLNGIAGLAFAFRRSRLGIIGPLIALAASVIMIAQARPEDFVDTTIYPIARAGDEANKLTKYVRVTGRLLRDQTVQTQVDVGGQTLSGSKYVPLMLDGAREPVFVRDNALPAGDGPVEIVGLVKTKASFPPIYIDIESPPNIPLLNDVARAGIVIGLVTLAWLILNGLLTRFDHALPTISGTSPRGSGMYWFGALGSANGNARVREAPLTMQMLRHETRFDTADTREKWSINVRQLLSATPTTIATSMGALPGLRVRFVDERGQRRSGALVAGDAAERDRALAGLRRMTQPVASGAMANGRV
jgi:hypothetical protein